MSFLPPAPQKRKSPFGSAFAFAFTVFWHLPSTIYALYGWAFWLFKRDRTRHIYTYDTHNTRRKKMYNVPDPHTQREVQNRAATSWLATSTERRADTGHTHAH